MATTTLTTTKRAATRKRKPATKPEKPQAVKKTSKASNRRNGHVEPPKRHTLQSAATWRAMGVEVSDIRGELEPAEQETNISFLRGGRYAEITTYDIQWQRRIESLGIKPRAITTFRDSKTEIRYYDRVPRSYVHMPSANGNGRG